MPVLELSMSGRCNPSCVGLDKVLWWCPPCDVWGGRGFMPPFRLSYPCGGFIISVLVGFYNGLILFLL